MRCLFLRYSFPVSLFYLIIIACQSEHPNTIKTFSSDDISRECAKANFFFDNSFDRRLSRDPEQQSYFGIKMNYGKWTDHSDAHAKSENDIVKNELDSLRRLIDFDKLDEQTRISYKYFEYRAQQKIDNFRWRFHNYPLNQMDGFQSAVPAFLINVHRIDSLPDAWAYIRRLNGIAELFRQYLEGLKIRDSLGIIPPKFVFPFIESDIQNVITGRPFENTTSRCPLLDDFLTKLNTLKNISYDEREKLSKGCIEALKNVVKPAYDELMKYTKDLEAKATNDDGAWKWPEGRKFYSMALSSTTTTDLKPEEIFLIGEQEVMRIHNEMRKIMKLTGWKKDNLHEFFEFMRKDPQFYFPNTREGQNQYKNLATGIIDTMRKQLDIFFKTKPKADIVVKAVEPFREQSAGGAFYEDPSADGARPGTYYINLYNMKDQPIYQAEALAYHEGIPGHHMQVAIAQELTGMPKFRKHGGNVAYVEVWALYSELLPKEYGFYKDPYSDFGRLSNEVFRAARLVVDVGIHYKKWTRQQAYEYFIKNTSNPEGDCRKEIDRYIVWPSQATGYKIGMLKILELREYARKNLGNRFDIRDFHDIVLTNGPLPLSLLSENVRTWVEKKQKEN
ncbi:MAG: DUF885 domain-containing protein [Bacteroidetes bacterium]|nr:DUF885 domain-containing protein [Bacteroidota bacterium]